MASSDYPRLSIEDFGEQLLRSGDLDPIYIALHRMQMPHEKLCKWLVAYWCWYSAGVACHMSELDDQTFWLHMAVAADNNVEAPHGGRWERAKERRHARGKQGLAMVADLYGRYRRPAAMVDLLCEPEFDVEEQDDGLMHWIPRSMEYRTVADRVQHHTLFGPWIAYKVCDMLERVVGVPIIFTEQDAMYEEPRKAALMVYRQEWDKGGTVVADFPSEERIVQQVVSGLLRHFSGHKAPPRMDRPVGYQEIETILCRWKGHVNHGTPVGNEIRELRHGMKPWIPVCGLAKRFLECLPEEIVS